MSVSLKEKFENVDILFDSGKIRRGYLVELIGASPKEKRYEIKSLKKNAKEKDRVKSKIDELIKREGGVLSKTKELERLNEELKSLTYELVPYGEITVKLEEGCINFQINVHDSEPKVFIFKEDEYFSPLIDYLEKDLGYIIARTTIE